MKTAAIFSFTLILALSALVAGSDLSRDEQIEIIENYLYVTGQSEVMSQSLAEQQRETDGLPIKSGTPAIIQFFANYDKLDKDLLLSLGVQEIERPDLDLYFDSPDGYFRIHYTVTGYDSVYRASVDVNSNGVPDYVDGVAAAADSVYDRIINGLGFPAPPPDSICYQGEDYRYDIYLLNLSSNIFGQTYPDTACIVDSLNRYRIVPAFLELDNDYQHVAAYRNRPLDAVRVTVAHEFFHAVQFGMDWSEWENLYWMEMSSTWMEEYLYDNINDYYAYLPYFYNVPAVSIQQFLSAADYHPYASVVFPIYLTEKYGPDIILDIWQRCARSIGGQFLTSAEESIDSISNHEQTFGKAFSEFALWNYFTGERAAWAPDTVGFSEGSAYPLINEDSIDVVRTYPAFRGDDANNHWRPEHNGATYIRFEETRTVQQDRFWVCTNGSFDTDCNDSVEVLDTLVEPYEKHDSLFTVNGYFRSMARRVGNTWVTKPWGLQIVYRYDDNRDSVFIESFTLPSATTTLTGYLIDAFDINDFYSVAFILTPASSDANFYVPRGRYGYGYYVNENGKIDSNLVDLQAAVLTPYPNPAVASQMGGEMLRFRFQMPMDSLSFPIYGIPYLTVDLYSIAGERIATVTEITTSTVREGYFEAAWDMKNAGGKDVASGVYLAYARLYVDSRKEVLLAEDKAKVAIIR